MHKAEEMTGSEADLAGVVVFHFPAARQLQLLVGEQVEEGHQVAVVLVAFEVMRVTPHLADHVLQTRVTRKHAVGTLREDRRGEEIETRCCK